MHNFDRPIGMGPDTSRQGSKLYSTLELGLDSFVDAVPVQRMLVNGMLKACSIFQANCVEVRGGQGRDRL